MEISLINAEINQLDNRSAMGVGPACEPVRMGGKAGLYNRFRQYSDERLAEISECADFCIEERYAAATLLGMIGDPRIQPATPAMQEIPAAYVSTGLDIRDVNKIVARYLHVGVKRAWIEKEAPRFYSSVDRFRMAKYPVTNLEYQQFLLDNPCGEIPTSWQFGIFPVHLSNHPVYTLSATAADQYAVWMSELTGRQFRLPTEVEWEYAAGGAAGYEFPWGDTFSIDCANTVESRFFATTPVGIFVDGNSPFGVSDMAGNVEEYTSDNYWVYPGGQLVEDDLLITSGCYRVARGGSFTRFSDLARCRRRHGRYDKSIYVMGFRLAESVEKS